MQIWQQRQREGERLNIAVICDVLGEENNGTTIAAMNLIRFLKERGHEVRVVCADAFRAGEPGYYVVPQFSFGPFNGYVAKNGVAPARNDPKVLAQALEGVDIIHVMMPFSLGKAAARYAQAHGIPLTAGFHCQAENVTNHVFLKDFGLGNRITYQIFHRRLYRYCDCIHYPTQFICDTYEAVVGSTPHRVISNGVSSTFAPRQVSRPKELEGKFVVFFTGRYSREKSHRVLLEAAARSQYRDRIQLIFAGTGPQEENLRRRAEKLGLLPPVMRFFSREELVEALNLADLYVHPAEIEIEAISCLEAIACGRVPLIADSPRSATRYFALSDRNLFHFNDPADLAQKMDWWLAHPEERERCAQSYLGYARQFDFRPCMERMEQMLLDTIEAKRHGA